MTTLSTRLSEKELEYLSTLAAQNQLYKGTSNELSLGKAMKELIKWCQLNKIDIRKVNQAMDKDIKKMIEQIHVSIPHLLYLSRLQILLDSDKVADERVVHCRQQTLDYLNTVCGDFQNVTYNEVRFSINDIGLKQTPIAKEKTLWKLP
jgi:hypothetical protein